MQPKQEERISTDTKAEMDPQNETDLKIAWRYKDVKGKISLDNNESCPKTGKKQKKIIPEIEVLGTVLGTCGTPGPKLGN